MVQIPLANKHGIKPPQNKGFPVKKNIYHMTSIYIYMYMYLKKLTCAFILLPPFPPKKQKHGAPSSHGSSWSTRYLATREVDWNVSEAGCIVSCMARTSWYPTVTNGCRPSQLIWKKKKVNKRVNHGGLANEGVCNLYIYITYVTYVCITRNFTL